MDNRNSRAAGYPGMDAEELARLQRLTGGVFSAPEAARPMAPDSTAGGRSNYSAPMQPAAGSTGGTVPSGISPATMLNQMGTPTAPMSAAAGTENTAAAGGAANAGMNRAAENPTAGMLPMQGILPPNGMSAAQTGAPALSPATSQPAGSWMAPAAAVSSAANTAASDAPTDADMQDFMEQGYLMGPNCFGRDARTYAERLMEYINDEYRDYLTYLALARRAPSSRARAILRRIAADEIRHARQWAAAYFLITGKRYFPERSTVEAAPIASYPQALRERYLAESQDAVKYRRFARETTDRCLRRLATETSNDERQHAQHILELIQQQYR